MPSFNRIVLLGNLTRDPQIKNLPSSTTVADFGLAMTRRFRTKSGEEREDVCFIDCAAFGKQAEVIAQYCRKGRSLLVEGRLKYDAWDDKDTGSRRSKISVVVENFQFMSARDESPSASVTGRQQPLEQGDARPAPASPIDPDKRHFDEAEIPF